MHRDPSNWIHGVGGFVPEHHPESNTNVASQHGHAELESELESELDDDDFDSDDEGHGDYQRSSKLDRIETAVLENVEDLEFASQLIVELHKDQVHREERTIGGWQKGVMNCQNSPGFGESSNPTNGSSNADQRGSNSSKRRRSSKSNGRGGRGISGSDNGDEERDDEGSGSPENHDEGSISGDPRKRYACTLNKFDPERFCSNIHTGDQFRVCESGFKTIQRLKYVLTMTLGIV